MNRLMYATAPVRPRRWLYVWLALRNRRYLNAARLLVGTL